MSEPLRIIRAEAEVERTRTQLLATLGEIATLLEPKKIVSEIWEGAKNKGADLAEEAVDAVKKRPVAVGGVVAALTMFLAREPIKDAAVKFYDAMTSGDEPKSTAAALKPAKKTNKASAPRPAARPARPASPRPRKKVEKVT